jgi:hypothetical protein
LHLLEQLLPFLARDGLQTLLFVNLVDHCLDVWGQTAHLVRGSQFLLALLNGRDKLVVDIHDLGDQILVAPGSTVKSMGECFQGE